MKKILAILVVVMMISPAHAGLVGWITSKTRSWDYIQQTGGIRVAQPMMHEGKAVLPVVYDATGSSGVTTRPKVMNSGQAVRRVDAQRAGNGQIVINVITQVVEKNSDTGLTHFADVSDLAAGTYEVFYATAGKETQSLGKITIL